VTNQRVPAALQQYLTLITPARLIQAATLILWVVAAILLARWVWLVLTPSTPTAPPVQQSQRSTANNTTTVNVASLIALNLFGENTQGPANRGSAQDAPKTQLNVRLVGVSASSVPERSAAIIEQGNNQQTYIVGDTLTNSQVTIDAIYADRVMLNNNGRLETLELEGIGELSDGLSLTLANSVNNTADAQPQADEQTEQLEQQALETLRDNPNALSDFIRIAPVNQGGTIQGYRLSPGSNPELFQAAGFESGDLAVAINGYDLTDVGSTMSAMEELQSGGSATITVVRNEEYIELELELPAIQGN